MYSWSSLHATCGNKGGQSGYVLQALGVCVLIADCSFWSQECRKLFPCVLQVPLPLAEFTSLGLKARALPTSFIFLFFSFWVPDIKDLKSNAYTEEVRLSPASPRKGAVSEKTQEDLYNSGWSCMKTVYNNKNKKTKTGNSGERQECHFQGYHILHSNVQFSITRKNNIQRSRKRWSNRRKKINQQKYPWERPDGKPTKDFKQPS